MNLTYDKLLSNFAFNFNLRHYNMVAKMFDEMFILFFVSLVIAAIVFHAVNLQGSFFVFWLAYYLTLGNGRACPELPTFQYFLSRLVIIILSLKPPRTHPNRKC